MQGEDELVANERLVRDHGYYPVTYDARTE